MSMRSLLTTLLLIVCCSAGAQVFSVLSYRTTVDSAVSIAYDSPTTVEVAPDVSRNFLFVYAGGYYYFEVWDIKERTEPLGSQSATIMYVLATYHSQPYKIKRYEYGGGRIIIWITPVEFGRATALRRRAWVITNDPQVSSEFPCGPPLKNQITKN